MELHALRQGSEPTGYRRMAARAPFRAAGIPAISRSVPPADRRDTRPRHAAGVVLPMNALALG
jgi:hypothetical protein